MATLDQIAQLRLLIAEPDDETYSDEALGALIDASSINGAAATVWTQKAAAAATLVNVSESGSSRSLGDLQKNALSMAQLFGSAADADGATAPGIRIRRVTRA